MQNSPHILCVNPWIHDFAAFDFWAKPLGLLFLCGILRDQNINISFIDCLDRFHPKEPNKPKILWDGRGPFRKTKIPHLKGLENIEKQFYRYGIKPQWFKEDIKQIKKPDIVFVTSLMTYWASGVKETIEEIKKIYPNVPVVLGGIYASLCYEHAKKYSMADLVVRGHGEKHLNKIIKDFTGFGLNQKKTINSFKTNNFNALDLQNKIAYAPLLTSRGCVFSCDYCASSYLEPKFIQKPANLVFKEIEFWHTKYKIKNFAFYDDALLINAKKHAFVLFEKIINSKINAFFHTPNALHIKKISEKASLLMFKAGFKTIRLGLETTDFSNNQINKCTKNEFFNAVKNLKKAGFKKEQLGAYLLCGLPNQNIENLEKSMRFVYKTGIKPILAYYSPIPQTKMWDLAVKHSRFDIKLDPVFTNNSLFPCVDSKAYQKRISQLKNLSF